MIETLVLQDAEAFILPTSFEEGKEKCPYDPARGFTGLIIGEQGQSCHQSWAAERYDLNADPLLGLAICACHVPYGT